MATLVLTAVGTAVGGPLGGAIGGLLGRQVDQAAFGGSSREGPRLKELAVTTSSYGQPIPRVFGRMRVAGSVIWSTELNETSSTDGGKGRPSTTTYSYSASFAVALSSAPINRIGRIWADGNLLRGANAQLKVGGEMRSYNGSGNQPVDSIIAADKGLSATAFRDCAYVVFENLQLAEFGNRIPALTFEVFGLEDTSVSLADLVPGAILGNGDRTIRELRGFSDEGGSLSATLSAIDRVLPITCNVLDDGIELSSTRGFDANIARLPEQLTRQARDGVGGRLRRRGQRIQRDPFALRYYDENRDYQPGVQRANGSRADGREILLDLPATLTADGAKRLANANAQGSRWQTEQMIWRIGQLDPSIKPGRVVRLPDIAGYWRITSWEWHDGGVELSLERTAPENGSIPASSSGIENPAADLVVPGSELHFFEVPPEDTTGSELNMYAAVSAQNASWNGATLFAENGATLQPIGPTGPLRSVVGVLDEPLASSAALLFEPDSSLSFTIAAADLEIAQADLTGIANGANRLLVGGEVIQFASATETAPGRWQLTGLLRGRGGTENTAMKGHAVGTRAALLTDRLVQIDSKYVSSHSGSTIAAVGRGDSEPVYAELENTGLSRRPPSPVHPRSIVQDDGSRELCWTRRARGQWRWDSLFEVPLIEDEEAYLVGIGPIEAPFRSWLVNEARFNLQEAEAVDLFAEHGPAAVWVRQIGTFAQSPALHLAIIDYV